MERDSTTLPFCYPELERSDIYYIVRGFERVSLSDVLDSPSDSVLHILL